MHGNCRLVRFRSVLKCYSLWTKWVLKFFLFGSDDINHSNFKNSTKCLNNDHDGIFLRKHVCMFYTHTQGFLQYLFTFSMEENKHLLTQSGYCQRCLKACVVCMTSAISWPNCVRLRVARIDIPFLCCIQFNVHYIVAFFFHLPCLPEWDH